MDGGQLTAVLIVAMIMIASIVRAKVRGPYRGRHSYDDQGQRQIQAENQRLRERGTVP
jgi:hypothetical protein